MKFNLKGGVITKDGSVSGEVIGRSEFTYTESTYQVLHSGEILDADPVETWFGESELLPYDLPVVEVGDAGSASLHVGAVLDEATKEEAPAIA